MGHYRANLRDIEFMLFEVLQRQEQVLGNGIYADLDVDTARSMLTESRTSRHHHLADAFEVGDRTPPVFDPATHEVTMPPNVQARL